jgi:hypothetical protein
VTVRPTFWQNGADIAILMFATFALYPVADVQRPPIRRTGAGVVPTI